MLERYSNAVQAVIQAAEEAATVRGQSIVGSEHLLYALLEYDRYLPVRVLASMGLSVEAMRVQLEPIMARHQGSVLGRDIRISEPQRARSFQGPIAVSHGVGGHAVPRFSR